MISSRFNIFLLHTERERIINEAISEAKLSARLKAEEAKTKAAMNINKKPTAADFLTKGFKRPSEKAARNGRRRLLLEDMVFRAERKLEELKKKQHPLASQEEKAEMLAEELFHRPGSLLKKEELAKMMIDSECEDERTLALPCKKLLNVDTFRTITGECNNRRFRTQGASATAFRRLVNGVYEDGIQALLGTAQGRNLGRISPFLPPHPSARFVSKTIVRDRRQDELPFTHILMQWGQFLDHDLDLGPELEAECEGCKPTEICEPIQVPEDDQKFGKGTPQNGDCLTFRRAIPTCVTDTPGSFSAREQINDVTSYIDGSMIYGSNRRQELATRAFKDGLLLEGPPVTGTRQPLLPVDKTGEVVACLGRSPPDCFLCGEVRCNEQVSLTVMHTIWLRQHNILAKKLKVLNPFWDDERLFQEARKIVGAMIQKITYFDYLPKVMGVDVFNSLVGSFNRYNRTVDASVPNAFATAAYRYGHSLVRPLFNRLGVNYAPLSIGPLNLRDMFFNPPQIRNSLGTDSIVRGWVSQNALRMDEFMNKVLTSQLFERDDTPGMDLASLNIQRQRDHGMPGYRTWRNFCQRTFPQLPPAEFENELTNVRFLNTYGDEDNIDLWVGGIAETRLPGSLLGPTFACLFGLTFRNVRDGDRFYFEKKTRVFTKPQLTEIRKTTLSRVLCDTSDTIRSIQPDAYLSNQTRQSCFSLPTVSLEPWREPICFFRVSLPSNFINTVALLLQAIKRDGVSPKEVFTNTLASLTRTCLPVPCPSSKFNVGVYAYPNITNLNSCTVRSTLANTPISGETASFYHRGIKPSDITSYNGLFSSFSQCRSATKAAITWTCSTETEATRSETIKVDDADVAPFDNLLSPDSLTLKPDGNDVFDKLLPLEDDDDDVYSNDNTAKVDDLEKELANSLVKDEDLLGELQKAMNNLN